MVAMKSPFMKTARLWTAALALVVSVGAAWAQVDTPAPADPVFGDEVKTQVIESMQNVLSKFAFVPGADFGKLPDMLAKQEKAIKESSDEGAFTGAVNKALQQMGFSHIVLYTPKFAEQRRTGKMVGLGVRIQIEDKGIRVTSVIPGTGAERAGLQAGDLIFLANGKKVTGPAELQGEEGSGVAITVKREVNKKLEDVRMTVIRHAFSTIIPETLTWPKKDVAVIKIMTFDVGYNRDNIKKLFDQAKGAKGLVLDLRSNGGGQVMNLLHLSGYFLAPDVPLGTFINKKMVNDYKQATGKDKPDVKAIAEWATDRLRPLKREVTPYAGKIAVLIDGGTGSASEMMAAALKENRDALIVGNKSAGAVLASVMVPIKYGYVLQYPVTDYVTIKGHRLEGDGVKPDVKTPITKFGEKDKAVEEAVKWIEKDEKKK